MNRTEKLSLSTQPWIVALLYVGASMLWLSFSHFFLLRSFPFLEGSNELDILEDSVYVLVSAGLLRLFIGWGQKTLRESHRRVAGTSEMLTAILEGAGEGIIGLDRTGRQTFVNRAASQLLGYEPEELVGQESHSIWHHTRRDGTPYPKEECPVYAAWRDGEVHRISGEVFWRKDGGSVLVDYISTPIRERGVLAGAVLIFRDVTKEARLEAIAEAVETMNSIGCVFAAVRHELGNPVNSIKMALAVLRKNLERFEPARVRDYLDRSLAEIVRVEDLLASLRSFSLYEDLKPQPVPLEVFLQGFVSTARAEVEAKGIGLDLVTTPGIGLVHADPRALRQVVLNCLANAVDAVTGRPQPRIALQAREGQPGLLEIRIEDNGCGMPEDVLHNLFKPFQTTKPHGTGLGLVIAKKMLTRMEGTIEVASALEEGTAVTITLRRADGAS